MNIFQRLTTKVRTQYNISEIYLAKVSLFVIGGILAVVVIASLLLRNDLSVPQNYNVKSEGSYSSAEFDIKYSIELDKYYVFIKYGAKDDFEDLKTEVEAVLTEFADIDDVNSLNIEYIDRRGVLQEDGHEGEEGLTVPLTEEEI